MGARLDLTQLPAAPLDAAAAFAADHLPRARDLAADDLVLLFDAGDHTHAAWRRAAVEELAREAAPARVNAVAGSNAAAVAEAARWLDTAPGITGQVLAVA